MTDRDLIAGSGSAVEDLVRAAMGAGAMCIMEKAAAGEIDPRAPLGDALGDFPAEFVKIRAGLVADVVAELAAQRPPLGYAAVYTEDGRPVRVVEKGTVFADREPAAFYADEDPTLALYELREVQP